MPAEVVMSNHQPIPAEEADRMISIARVREIIENIRQAKREDTIVAKHGAFRWEDDALRNVEQALEFET
jgi:hypothetical protein